MSASSEAAPSVEEEALDLDALSARVHKKLSFPLSTSLPVAAHRSAGSCMLRLRDAVLRGQALSQAAKMSLLCAGANCARRVSCETDDEASVALIKTTQALLFSLLALSEPKLDVRGESDDESTEGPEESEAEPAAPREPAPKRRRPCARDEEQLLAAWRMKSLADKLSEFCADSSWSTLLKSDAAVSRAALKEAQFVTKGGSMPAVYELSSIFFRCSASAMAASMIASVQPKRAREPVPDFLTLDTVSMLNDANEHQDEKLRALADAAESEAGQAVMRDLILSFKLPQQAVGVRRTVQLSRASNSMATKQYPEVLNGAHEAAMRGAMWTFEEDADEVHKMSALLAGLALVLVKDKDDIRKGSAFAGRVCLPFLDTPPPPPSAARLALLPESNEWVVFSLGSSGKPKVRCKKRGYEGFCQGLLLVSRLAR